MLRIVLISLLISAASAGSLNAQCTANAGVDIDPCLNSPSISLPSGGTWTGAPASMLTPGGIFTPNQTGTYNLTFTITSGSCTATDDKVIIVRPLPTTNAGADQTICQGQTVQLSASATSPNGAITLFTWSGGSVSNPLSANPMATPSSTTTYNVTAVDIEGCSKPDQVTITINPSPSVNAGPNLTLCNDPVPTQLTGNSPAGGTWSGTGVDASGNFTPPGTGSFTITYTYTNSFGCSKSATRTITVTAPGSIDAGPDRNACMGSSAFQLSPVTSGGTWSGSSYVTSTGVFNPGAAGLYTLTYTLNTGTCNSTDQIDVTVHALPSVNAGNDVSICQGTPTVLNGQATGGQSPYTIIWSPSATLSSASSLTPTATPVSTVTYLLTIIDNLSCTSNDAVTVTVNALPVVEAGNNVSVCSNSLGIQLTGQSPSGGVFSGTGVSASGYFTPTATGSFTITYSYTNGSSCTATDTRTVTVLAPAPVNAGNNVQLCHNASPLQLLPITPNGTWSGSTFVTSAGVFTPSSVNTYSLTYTVTSGVCTSTDQVNVTVNPLPVANAGNDVGICAGGSVQLNGSASGGQTPYFVNWNASPALSSTSTFTPTATPPSTANFVLNVTDNRGCASSDNVTVSVSSAPSVNAGQDITFCAGSAATQLTGNSPSGGTYSGSGVTASGLFTPSSTGSFSVTYTYTNPAGCAASDIVNVTVVAPSPVNAGPDPGVCKNSPSFQLQPVTPNGTWSGSSNVTSAGVFSPVSAGSYTLTYSVNTGICVSSDQVTVSVFDLPVANAGNDITICLGQSVQLNGTVTGGSTPYDYQWSPSSSLDDDASANPTASPSSQTTYTLAVTDNHGCASSDAVTISVSSYPVVNAGPDLFACNQPVQVTLQGYSPAGGTWTGNGVTSSGVFTPSSVGVAVLTYTYANSSGCSSSDQININVNNAPVINAGADQTICLNGVPFALSSGTSSTGIWSGTGIGNSTTGLFNPVTAGTGTHLISLSDGAGTCFVVDQVQVTVSALPAVSAGTNQAICANAPVTTLAGFSPNGGSWQGPGIINSSTGQFNPGIGTGSYSMFYYYTDVITGCTDTANKIIVVNQVPVAAFTVADTTCINAALAPSNLSTGASSYEWDFGDNSSIISGQAPNHTYNFTGTYPVELSATNNFGCTAVISHSVEAIAAPVAGMQLSAVSGCEPLSVNFSNTTSGVDVDYSWDLGTGTSNAFQPPTKIYTVQNGVSVYHITLIASNMCGSGTATQDIDLHPGPLASFDTQLLSTVCSPVTVSFQNQSTGSPFSCHWNLGDGEDDDLNTVTPDANVYTTGTQASQYVIWLHVENECGIDSVSQTIVVQPNNVTASFAPDVNHGCTSLEVNMHNASAGATNYTYAIPDLGWTSNDPEPAYTFATAGNFDVYLYASDGCGFDTVFVPVEVLQSPDIDFITDLTYSCEQGDVIFTAVSSSADQFEWDFDDQSTSTLPVVTHSYDLSGVYEISLKATAPNSCVSEMTRQFEVKDNPVSDFNLSEVSGCSPFQTCLQNISTGAEYYVWDFGDGQTSSEDAPCHSFENAGTSSLTRTVHLIVTNSFLCADSISKEIVIEPVPSAQFTLDLLSSCAVPSLVHPQLGDPQVTAVQWSVNGISVSSESEPEITLSEAGLHDIEAEVTNEFGCISQSLEHFEIFEPAVAGLSASPLNGCLDLDVQFSNESSNSSSFQWLFGDGSTSTETSPQHTYDQQGVFDVQLIVISQDGCQDTLVAQQLIETFDLPVAAFEMSPEETSIYLPEIQFTSTSADAIEYSWSFGDGATSVSENPVYSYTYPGTWPVTLTVYNLHGCAASTVRYMTVNNDYLIFVPNAFTPDDDGLNDVFKPEIENTGFISEYTFQIFDRWGQTVFETSDPAMGWMGNVKGGDYYAENASYNYRIVLRTHLDTDTKEIKGHVTLLR